MQVMTFIYFGQADKYCDGFTAANDKLTIKFVSNRNLSLDVAKHIKDCQKLLSKKNYQRTANVLKLLNEECRNDIQKYMILVICPFKYIIGANRKMRVDMRKGLQRKPV